MKQLILFSFCLLTSLSAYSSTYYNINGGFGFYQPEGWRAREIGRSCRLTGPATDIAQSDFFIGSDWVTGIATLEDLRSYVSRETVSRDPKPVAISGLQGFQTGSARSGKIFLLRSRENVIVIEFNWRGSRPQVDEGQDILSSIDIRTQGIEY